nr:transposase [Oscillospiraceae bacterium]
MDFPKRKPNRLKSYDYSTPGMYFVTICTEGRRKTLCEIVGDGFPVPKPAGILTDMVIKQIPVKFPQVRLEHYVVMPNHIHMLLSITGQSGTGNPSPTLGTVIGWYKYQVTKRINEEQGTAGKRFFQRSFHDHVIRGERDYQKIWNYIEGNPMKWAEDCFYTE